MKLAVNKRATGKARKQADQANQPVSIQVVAERAGVSVATVSRVINGVSARFSAATEVKVRTAIAELDYRPARAGRTLRQGESRLVAVLAANLANPAMAAVAASTEEALRKCGYVMVLCDTHEEPDLQDEYLAEMRAHSATAMVLLGAVKSQGLSAACQRGQRIVFVSRRNPLGTADNTAFVGIDNVVAGSEVADWLQQRRLLNVGLLHGPLASSATGDRVAGFIEQFDKHGPVNTISMATVDTTDHLQIGYHGVEKLLQQRTRPEAIFCLSDLIAYGAARRLNENGLIPGHDICLIGFDGSPLNSWIAPWLNSVRVPYRRFGTAIADVIGEMEQQGGSVGRILQHQIVECASNSNQSV